MATSPETIDFILESIGNNTRFTTRKIFGEYALYADGRVVALVCNDQLYVKIHEASNQLEECCDKDYPYPGARLHYLVEESQLHSIDNLALILFALAKVLPPPKKKKKHESKI